MSTWCLKQNKKPSGFLIYTASYRINNGFCYENTWEKASGVLTQIWNLSKSLKLGRKKDMWINLNLWLLEHRNISRFSQLSADSRKNVEQGKKGNILVHTKNRKVTLQARWLAFPFRCFMYLIYWLFTRPQWRSEWGCPPQSQVIEHWSPLGGAVSVSSGGLVSWRKNVTEGGHHSQLPLSVSRYKLSALGPAALTLALPSCTLIP